MNQINFNAKLVDINSWTILHLPKEASAKLPSRGPVMIEGTINGTTFKTLLEPDGKAGHWFRVENSLAKKAQIKSGDSVKMAISTTDEWIEPEISADLKKALSNNPKAEDLWKKVTTNAHWEWIRWIRATKNPETRQKRIDVAMSKLKSGMRRPCCFNRNACTEPAVSDKWILLEPQKTM